MIKRQVKLWLSVFSTKVDGTVIPYTLASSNIGSLATKMHTIETFNGSYFFGLPGTAQTKVANKANYYSECW